MNDKTIIVAFTVIFIVSVLVIEKSRLPDNQKGLLIFLVWLVTFTLMMVLL